MRSFKKIAAMIMAVAMLCSFTAFAATVTLDDIADVASNAPTVEINYTSDASQNTMLAYAGTELSGANIVYIDQLAKGATIPEIALDSKGPYGTYTVVVGGTEVATAASKTFEYTDATPKYDVTLTASANGTVSYDAASLEDVREGSVITFEFAPYLGYQLTSLLVNNVETVSEVDGSSYELTVNADTTVVPVFTEVVGTTENTSYTYDKIIEVESILNEATGETEPESMLTFGKANEKTDATITSMGMFVQKKNDSGDWEDFYTTGDEAYGPKFAAARWTSDMKYGIRFFGFEAGEYKINSYVEYSDGTEVTGAEIEFEVE